MVRYNLCGYMYKNRGFINLKITKKDALSDKHLKKITLFGLFRFKYSIISI